VPRTLEVTKGAGSKKAALAMASSCSTPPKSAGGGSTATRLTGVKFKDGIKVTDDDTATTDEKVAA
jgi:hypothetical protein